MNKILLLLVFLIAIIFIKGSSFTATMTSDSNSKYDSVSDRTVLIFYAPWCGHCKSSMPEFTKASESPNTDILLVNSDDPAAKSLMNKYSVNGFPTIVRGDNTPYTGERTSQDIIDFANS